MRAFSFSRRRQNVNRVSNGFCWYHSLGQGLVCRARISGAPEGTFSLSLGRRGRKSGLVEASALG